MAALEAVWHPRRSFWWTGHHVHKRVARLRCVGLPTEERHAPQMSAKNQHRTSDDLVSWLFEHKFLQNVRSLSIRIFATKTLTLHGELPGRGSIYSAASDWQPWPVLRSFVVMLRVEYGG